ncbi:MAG: hypothetical protein PUD70_03095 [Firmicutes bacterium]|nr:hypothetical protein [Bacillota bacterium]
MTQSEIMKKEAEEIASSTGRYIPPYRMASLMRSAQKIFDLLVKTDVCTTYEESIIILDIVRGAIRSATGKED